FVKRSLVAERPEIKLERLELDAKFVGHEADADRREIRLAGARADAGELGAFHADLVVPPRPRVGKSLQLFGRMRRHAKHLSAGAPDFPFAGCFSLTTIFADDRPTEASPREFPEEN